LSHYSRRRDEGGDLRRNRLGGKNEKQSHLEYEEGIYLKHYPGLQAYALTKIMKLISNLNKQWPDPVSNKSHRLFQ
jgi:hypothetical protein